MLYTLGGGYASCIVPTRLLFMKHFSNLPLASGVYVQSGSPNLPSQALGRVEGVPLYRLRATRDDLATRPARLRPPS
jgi:hypothetical protein